jgi:hypothetical protein
MTETPYATGTAETAAAPDAGDSPRYDEAGLGAGHDEGTDALTAEDQLPARQDSRNATWGDSPEYDEIGLGDGYDGDTDALTVEDQLPARQDSRAATWGDDPGYYDEAGLGAEYDGDLDALAAEDHALDSGQGDQDQAAADEVPPAAGKPGDLPADVSGGSAPAAPEQEDGNVAAFESSPAGAPADTGSTAKANAGAGERPAEAPPAEQADALIGQAAQPGDGHADPGTASDAGLEELKAEYEASLKDLKAELQALKDLWQPVPDAPEGTGREADQPRANVAPADQKNQKEVKPEGDRQGLWSNAKYALYGAVGTTVGMALLDQFAPGVSRVVDDVVVGGPTVIGALVPTLREGWKRKHDNSPDNR